MDKTPPAKRFTLVDLFALIVIITLLTVILWPIFARAREKNPGITCTSKQRHIIASIQMYAEEHKESLPPAAIVWQSIKIDPVLLICPGKEKLKPNGYGYVALRSGQKLSNTINPAKSLVCADIKDGDPIRNGNIIFTMNDIDLRHSGHAVCGFMDGHVALETDIGKNDIPAK